MTGPQLGCGRLALGQCAGVKKIENLIWKGRLLPFLFFPEIWPLRWDDESFLPPGWLAVFSSSFYACYFSW